MIETVDVKITKIRYKSDARSNGSAYYIFSTDKGFVAKGSAFFELSCDMFLRLEGFWQKSKFNGANEFTFKSAVTILPTSSKARFEYACSITKGIGKALQKAIWAKVGEDWETSDLSGIAGVGESTKQNWTIALREISNQRQRAEAFAWMLERKLTKNMAAISWNKWEAQATAVINADPYELARLPNYGFAMIDEMILANEAWGIGLLDERRIKAAILYILDANANNGNTIITLAQLTVQLAQICKGASNEVVERIINKSDAVEVVNAEFGDAFAWVARKKDKDNETMVWERFKCN